MTERAPMLTHIVEHPNDPWIDADRAAWAQGEARRELRALLAVAKAADRLIVRRPGYFIVRDGIQYAKPLRDALDRLARKPRGRSGSAGGGQ